MSGPRLAEILACRRAELDELERFASTEDYPRLLGELAPFASHPESRLIDWLIQPMVGTGLRPLDVYRLSGGVERVTDQLRRIVHGGCA